MFNLTKEEDCHEVHYETLDAIIGFAAGVSQHWPELSAAGDRESQLAGAAIHDLEFDQCTC